MRVWRERNPRPAGGVSLTDDEGRKAPQVDPERAEHIRWAAEQILNGWTRTEVARELRRRGFRGAYGGIVGPFNLAAMLTAPAVAGLRAYHGEIIGKATWEPVLDEPTWRAVRGRAERDQAAGEASPRTQLPAAQVHLLRVVRPGNGRGVDARAGEVLVRVQEPHVRRRCGDGGGYTAIQVDPADDELQLGQSARSTWPPATSRHRRVREAGRRDEIAGELEALAAQRAEWVQARDAGQLNLAEYLAAKAKFDGRQAQLETDLASLPRPSASWTRSSCARPGPR